MLLTPKKRVGCLSVSQLAAADDLESPDDELLVVLLELSLLPVLEVDVSEFETFFFLPVLKSVSYQPPPLRRNAAAETSLLRLGSSHAGQIFNGSSEIFWSFSSLC